jgi:putative nucleotidyltransferase with HDIG domain
MKMAQKSPIPAEVISVAEALEKAGFQAYLVGGCVRDLLLGREPNDWDFTTNATPEQIVALFPKTVYENKFGTVAVIQEETLDETVKVIEVTPYRIESAYSDRRHPDEVKFSKNIENDLKRRDFTINAMAASLSGGAIKDMIDLHGGMADLKAKTVRCVGNPSDRFTEDALRLIKAVRMAVQLDFNIENATYTAIQSHNSLIKDVSMERIRDEFTKIILSDNPKKGIELLSETGLLKHFLPELERGKGVTQNQAHAFDVWEHLLRSLQHAADKKWSLEIRLAALFHDISKPETKGLSRETHQITFYGHEVKGSRETRKILEKMRFSREIVEKVAKLVRWHMFFSDTETITLSAVRRMIVNVGKENIWDLMDLRICDRIGTGRPKEDPYRLRKYKAMVEEALRDPISVGMLKINGNRIIDVSNTPAGPRIGNMLHALFDEVLDDPALNTAEYLEKRSIELAKLSDKELAALGEKGREKKQDEESKNIGEIRGKYHVR